jgi:hypothetical protein
MQFVSWILSQRVLDIPQMCQNGVPATSYDSWRSSDSSHTMQAIGWQASAKGMRVIHVYNLDGSTVTVQLYTPRLDSSVVEASP